MYNNFWPLRRPHPQGFSWHNKVLFALHEEPKLSEKRLYVLTRARGRPCQFYKGADAAGEQFIHEEPKCCVAREGLKE